MTSLIKCKKGGAKGVQILKWAILNCLGLVLFVTPTNLSAQSPSQGKEPQSLENTDSQVSPSQSQFYPNGEIEGQELQSESPNWLKKVEKRMAKKAAKRKFQRPNRPIPAVMLVLGFVFLFLWIGILLITALAALSVGAFVLLLILTILLSPLAILGILFIIGGMVGMAA